MPENIDTNHPSHRFSADRPIESVNDDKLERELFAERVAADINGWHGNDSLVISLNGKWGSGKTTLKNFIKEKLLLKQKSIIVEFNPWAWSGQDKMTEGFFGTLRAVFRVTDKEDETHRMVERWEQLEVWTKLGAELSENINKGLTTLCGGSIATALLTGISPIPWIRTGGMMLGVFGILASVFFAIFPSIASRMVEYARMKAGKAKLSPEELQNQITTQLKGLHKKHGPVVVFVDDIDRLNAEEIRLLFQLVKVNADFPNLVYLLLFQTDIVTKALSQVASDSGSEYLKKIVQVPIEVPQASRELMQQIFRDGLKDILTSQNVEIRWDNKRFAYIFDDYLWFYVSTLRDVKRFLGLFDFYFHGQVESGTLQVNALDLLIIEMLRTFDHEVYLDICDSIGLFQPDKSMIYLYGDTQRELNIAAEIEAIVKKHGKSDAHKARLKAVLRNLFPESLSDDDRRDAERDLRVCHTSHFSKYFQYCSDKRATSAASISQLLRVINDRERLVDRFREIMQNSEIEQVFSKLLLYFDNIPTSAAEPFIGALFDIGDDLPEKILGLFNEDPYRVAGRMVYMMLRKLSDSQTRAHVFAKCLESSEAITTPIIAMRLIEPSMKNKGEQVIIFPVDLEQIRLQCLNRIRQYAVSGKIWSTEHIKVFLYSWINWSSQTDVNDWLASELNTPIKKAEFLSKMVTPSVINGSRIEFFLDGNELEKFINIEQLLTDIASVQDIQLTAHQVSCRKLLQKTVNLKVSGNNYNEVRESGALNRDQEDGD